MKTLAVSVLVSQSGLASCARLGHGEEGAKKVSLYFFLPGHSGDDDATSKEIPPSTFLST